MAQAVVFRCADALGRALAIVRDNASIQAKYDATRQQELDELLSQLRRLGGLPSDVLTKEAEWLEDATLHAEFFARRAADDPSNDSDAPSKDMKSLDHSISLLEDHVQRLLREVPVNTPEPGSTAAQASTAAQTSTITYDSNVHKTADLVFGPNLACLACNGQRPCVWTAPGRRCAYCASRQEGCYILHNDKRVTVNSFCAMASKDNSNFLPKQTRQRKGRVEAAEELSTTTRGEMAQRMARQVALTTRTLERALDQGQRLIAQAEELHSALANVGPAAAALGVWAGSPSALPSNLSSYMVSQAAHPDSDTEMDD